MKYDFDAAVPRTGTRSFKWDFRKEDGEVVPWSQTDPRLGPEQTLPMWVADMDFYCAPPIVEAVTARASDGVYGYTYADDTLYQVLVNWMDRRHKWAISPDWIRIVPASTVPGLHMMVQTYSKPGERVLIQSPVYYPFSLAIENNGGEIVHNPLLYEDDRYYMDFDDLEKKASDPAVTLAILCSPHNPVGRVWSREELTRFAEICVANGVVIVADEIHCDLVYKDYEFVPLATLGDEIAENTVMIHAPSKTFNLAGMHTSNLIIPGEKLREQYDERLKVDGLFGLNPISAAAFEAAYTQCDDWLDQLLEYLQGNCDYMASYFAQNLPQLPVIKPEATYLVWFDCRSLGLSYEELEDLMFNRAKIYLDEGYIFGSEGEGFERINIACPRATVTESMERIEAAVTGLKG